MMAKWPLAKCPLAKCPLAKCLLAKYPLAKCPDTGWTIRRQCWKYNITHFLMVEDLNHYFSSVFTRENSSSLPVPDATFLDYLGQLIVTPEIVAKKIKAMNDNKSPGVDGIPPKLLMETVEQIKRGSGSF